MTTSQLEIGVPLQRAPHLSGPDAFKRVLNAGTVARSAHFSVHFSPDSHWQVGALVPKRWAKRAVTRNAVRRQVYAWFDAAMRGPDDQRPAQGWFVVRLRASFAAETPACAKSRMLTQAVRAELAGMSHKVHKGLVKAPSGRGVVAAPAGGAR